MTGINHKEPIMSPSLATKADQRVAQAPCTIDAIDAMEDARAEGVPMSVLLAMQAQRHGVER